MTEEIKFNCTGCGACCKLVGRMVFDARLRVEMGEEDGVIKELAEFPYPAKEDGSCSMLNPDNTCAIYEDRPDICKVHKMYDKYHSHRVTRQEYYAENEKACAVLQGITGDKKPE